MGNERSKLREAEASAVLDLLVTAGNQLKSSDPPLVRPTLPSERDERRSSEADTLLGDSEWMLSQLVEEFAEAARARVCRAVVTNLRRLPGMMDGGDSMLRNAWDEICVQVQFQESVFWESAYLPTIEQLIKARIAKLSKCEKRAIWLQSEEGSSWLNDLDFIQDGQEGRYDGSGVPYDDESVIELVLDSVLTEAANYENSRISASLDRGSDEPSLLD